MYIRYLDASGNAELSDLGSNHYLLVGACLHEGEPQIHSRFEAIRRTGHLRGKLGHVIEIPLFADSERFCGLQIADVCAYAVRRYLDRGAVVGSHEERNFQRIFHRFDQDNMGRLHGLRHYTPSGSCNCLICQQRGHAPTLTPS